MNVHRHIVFGSGRRGTHTLVPEILETGWGRFGLAGSRHLRPHAHADAFEFCFILSGKVEWGTRISREVLREGDIYVSQPGEVHWGRDAARYPCSLYWVILGSCRSGFDWNGVNGELALELDKRLRSLDSHRIRGSSKLRAAFREIFQEHWLSPGSRYQMHLRQGNARTSLLDLLIELVRTKDSQLLAANPRSGRAELPSEAVVSAV
jgi:AraC family transcriptional regulator, L-rhamnose operon regulatory protein RhaS